MAKPGLLVQLAQQAHKDRLDRAMERQARLDLQDRKVQLVRV
ncbi:MAG: hypothetical protein WAN17_15245 [Candidatus Sulfotelmatobacter sp.]